MPIYNRRPGFIQRNPQFQSFTGRVTQIDDVNGEGVEAGCSKYVMVENEEGQLIQFIVNPNTYFVDRAKIDIDSIVTVFYNLNTPAILIYPPQLEAVVMALDTPNVNVKVDMFDDQMLSSDGTLQVNIGPDTEIISENGQNFYGPLTNHPAIVLYGPTTRSIPPQAAAEQVVVLCRH